MTFLVLAAGYLRAMLLDRNSIMRAWLGLSVALCSAFLGLAVFRFIQAADVSQYAGPGYEQFSMNLLAPVDPWNPGSFVLRARPINQVHGEGYNEGYNYLGLGVLLLGFVAIARRPSSLGRMSRVEAIPAIAIFLVSLLLALSLWARVGRYTLWHLAAPHPMMAALSSLRASGRLFWPGYYLIFIGVIAVASRAFRLRSLQFALGVALAIQLLDLTPLRAYIRNRWQSSSAPAALSAALWHELGSAQEHLVLVPAWQCDCLTGGRYGYEIFGMLALWL